MPGPRSARSTTAKRRLRRVRALMAVARGVALFFGVFSLLNLLPTLLGRPGAENIWWIDTSRLPGLLGAGLEIAGAVLLIAFAVRPNMARWRRGVTGACAGALGLLALSNTVDVLAVARRGGVTLGVPVPFSVAIALGFALVAIGTLVGRSDGSAAEATGALLTAALLVVAFPLAQTIFFGMTDYRAPADVAVVLGARVYDNGSLSPSLDERVRTGVDLYQTGEVSALLMSGGIGANGVDESVAMKRRAVELGVPGDAVLLDNQGVNTDATVADTRRIMRERGWDDVLVVSHFYHLPRIKLAFRVVGTEVRTVPAQLLYPIGKTPIFVAREVPAFWVYWGRALGRSLVDG